VINCKVFEGDYVKSWAEVELLPGAARAVALLSGRGLPLFVVTNQRGVLAKVASEIAEAGSNIDSISMEEDRALYAPMLFGSKSATASICAWRAAVHRGKLGGKTNRDGERLEAAPLPETGSA
jgi:hypothetical protein